MPPQSLPQSIRTAPGAGLAGRYTRVTLWYLLAVWVAWSLGLEGIYNHPFPFYAFIAPIFSSLTVPALLVALFFLLCGLASDLQSRSPRPFYICAAMSLVAGILSLATASYTGNSLPESLADLTLLPWYVLSFGVFWGSLVVLVRVMDASVRGEAEPDARQLRRILVGLAVFAFVFPATVAMLRDGPLGISQAYSRQALEYIKDIGLGGSIRGLFRDYVSLHPYLSMHAQVHPPGPIVILWIMSFGVGQSPMALSLTTMAFGALSVFPMYGWARELFERRVAIICTMLYTLVPSIVIFTATSADIAFMPFTLTTLFLFQRALNRSSISCALAAGLCYGILSVTSFSLITIGAYFAFAALLRLRSPDTRRAVIQTAIAMIAGLIVFHVALRLWSGFDVIEVFRISREKFDVDQYSLDIADPRLPSWAWRLANPMCWFFFAGIPVSVLFVWRLKRADTDHRALFYAFAATLVVLDILYLARGEGERSAMYIIPFLVIPAGHLLQEFCAAARSTVPLVATAVFLALQTWCIESILYTYW